MPRSRRIRGGLASPVIAALINSMPDPGDLWPSAERQKWLSALQAALNLAYRQAEPTDDELPHERLFKATEAEDGK
jgi:hypothetical protein